jgi:hypothetical protein
MRRSGIQNAPYANHDIRLEQKIKLFSTMLYARRNLGYKH